MQSPPSIDPMDQLLHEWRGKIPLQKLAGPELDEKGITWDVLRADLIHPVCSGNKLFKLYYYLKDAVNSGHHTIHTFGGAWSNHIVATAFAARQCGLRAIGYIRGEEPSAWSSTLLEARSYGMELIFLPRHEFDFPKGGLSKRGTFQEGGFPKGVLSKRGTFQEGGYEVPMGGYGETGARGAAMMLEGVSKGQYTHILCAGGTGTMAAGLALADTGAALMAINVVKGFNLEEAVKKINPSANFTVLNDYQFGGYARSTEQLLDFMNKFYGQNSIPTDFVYTGKLMFAIEDLINKNAFPEGSRVLAIHSGGLQGNKSLKNGRLHF